jgi:hypothetical protein
LIAVGLLVAAAVLGCQNEHTDVVIDENDGDEIMALASGIQGAVENDDEAAFASCFTSPSVAKPIWKRLANMKWNDGEYTVERLTSFPGIERAVTDVHVKKLVVSVWYDLSPTPGKGGEIYKTTWELARMGRGWKISQLRIEKDHTSYGDLVRELRRMDQFSFQALDMDWEDYGDPSALLVRALRAMDSNDVDALKLCTVDGALFRAYEKRIEMPTVANGDTPSGKSNRKQSGECLDDQVEGLHEATEVLGMTVDELAPFITAYRITRVPVKCSKIGLMIRYEGPSDSGVTSFDVGWTAAYVMQKWLAEFVGVEAVRGWNQADSR